MGLKDYVSMPLCYYVSMSLCHDATIALWFYVAISLWYYFTKPQYHYITLSLHHYVITSALGPPGGHNQDQDQVQLLRDDAAGTAPASHLGHMTMSVFRWSSSRRTCPTVTSARMSDQTPFFIVFVVK